LAEASASASLENRQRIYNFVRRTPGAHLREVQRALGLPYGTAEYHLHALERTQLVRTSMDGNLKRFFAADFAFTDRTVLGLLRKRPIRAVVVALMERGEMTHQELAEAARVKPPTLSYHLPKLERAGVVETRRDGRFTRVSLADAKAMERLLVAYGRSFADGAVDRFLRTWANFKLHEGPEAPKSAEGDEEDPKGPA
jgi:predicted transcriptional regulator